MTTRSRNDTNRKKDTIYLPYEWMSLRKIRRLPNRAMLSKPGILNLDAYIGLLDLIKKSTSPVQEAWCIKRALPISPWSSSMWSETFPKLISSLSKEKLERERDWLDPIDPIELILILIHSFLHWSWNHPGLMKLRLCGWKFDQIQSEVPGTWGKVLFFSSFWSEYSRLNRAFRSDRG